MKLIDILVRESVEGKWRWPDGVDYIEQYTDNTLFSGSSWEGSDVFERCSDFGCDSVNIEEYESALEAALASKNVPAWNGEGLPPVGMICQARIKDEWVDVKVAYIGNEGGWNEALVFEVKSTRPAWADEFRPLRTEADRKRDEAVKAIAKAGGADVDDSFGKQTKIGIIGSSWFDVYDAIAAGKIPGVKLE